MKYQKYHMMYVTLPKDIGFWRLFWGVDIFIEGFPLIKILIALEILTRVFF
ncbi:MAG: hypothetical protein WC974_08535 [Thermoplasmata archaeon]